MLESAEKLIELRIPAEAVRLTLLRSSVKDVTLRVGLGCDMANNIVLAVDEACANIIKHGYHDIPGNEIRLSIYQECNKNALIFVLKDDAPCVDVTSAVPRDLNEIRPGGLGLHFIQNIMDEVTFMECEGKGNTLLLIKYLEN